MKELHTVWVLNLFQISLRYNHKTDNNTLIVDLQFHLGTSLLQYELSKLVTVSRWKLNALGWKGKIISSHPDRNGGRQCQLTVLTLLSKIDKNNDFSLSEFVECTRFASPRRLDKREIKGVRKMTRGASIQIGSESIMQQLSWVATKFLRPRLDGSCKSRLI